MVDSDWERRTLKVSSRYRSGAAVRARVKLCERDGEESSTHPKLCGRLRRVNAVFEGNACGNITASFLHRQPPIAPVNGPVGQSASQVSEAAPVSCMKPQCAVSAQSTKFSILLFDVAATFSIHSCLPKQSWSNIWLSRTLSGASLAS